MKNKAYIGFWLFLLILLGCSVVAEPNTTGGVDKGLFTGMLHVVSSDAYVSGEQVETLIAEGERMYSNSSHQEAITVYKKILSIYPDSPAGWLGLARAESASGLYEDALESVRELLFRDPENWHGYLLQGAVLSSLSRYPEAVESYQAALQINETDPYTWAGYGAALFWNKAYDQARDACKKSQELNASLPSAYYWDGVSALELGDPVTALSRMNKVLSLDPKFSDAYIISSNIQENNGDISAALDIITSGIDRNPASGRLWTRKGELLEKQQRKEDAIEAYREAIRINPDDVQAKERLEDLTGEAG